MNEITAKRKQFEQNLQKSSKRKAFEIEDDSQVEITKKVDQAIDEAIRSYEKPTREKIVRKSKSVEKTTKLAPKSSRTFRRATADRLAKSKVVTKNDKTLRNIYGKAAWEASPQKVRNPYVHVNSPEKRKITRNITNVQVAQAKNVRSQKQQTTPRTEYSAVQIAPPVRAGPIDRTENPSPVLTTESSISEKAPTPKVITPEPVLRPEPPAPKEPIEKPIKLRGSKVEREPPVIIKPAYNTQPVGVTESQLDNRIGSLKGWIESELMGKLFESRQQQPREEQLTGQLSA